MQSLLLLKKATQFLWTEWIRPLATIAAILLPIKSVIADYNFVPTGSMKPTILEGDVVWVNKLAYDLKVPFTLFRLAQWNHPTNGDIVVFFSPKDGTRLVKRVIACPGDSIEMKDNVLFLNDQRMEYTVLNSYSFSSEIYEDVHSIIAKEENNGLSHWVMSLPSRFAARNFNRVVVPPGKYFMMGDSRDNSYDSRYFGFIDREQIVGRAERVLLSVNKNHYYIPRTDRLLDPL